MSRNENIAIQVKNVSKTFKIPHEKISTVRGAFVNILKKKTYEEFKALDDVSFEVKKGEFFGIIGRNGSGKSTLLKVLAGIYQADAGRVKVNGLISPFLELGIGFNPELSGRDNIYLNGTVLGLTKKQIDEKFNDIVGFSELERFIDQKLKNYSSGMQVRLAFSVAIHANREILLMDEVLAVGDSNFQQKCLEEFNKYRDLGKTVILVTHDISTIQKYCDRAMLLRKGKIEMIGDPEEVGNKYIYQNMSDEEKRIFDEEKKMREKTEKELEERKKAGKNQSEKKKASKKAEREKPKKKIAEITKVEILDKDGNEKNVFQTGDELNIKITFKTYESLNIRKLGFGVGLYDCSDKKRIFGCIMRNKIIKNEQYVKLKIYYLPLLRGQYYLNVSCFQSESEKLLDVKENAKNIKIYSGVELEHYKGILYSEHKWS